MMKLAMMVLLALGVCLALGKELRLIKVNEEAAPSFVSEEELDLLRRIGVNFMDITETPFLEQGAIPKVAMAFPSKPSHQDEVRSLIKNLSIDRFRRDLTTLSQDFLTRHYRAPSGAQSADWVFKTVSDIAANRSDVFVSQFTHKGYDQKSCIARIGGRVADGPMVIIGAHQDSINMFNPSGRSPGADDDGSGSITVLEVFRVLVESGFVPQLAMEFHWYAAEEAGLLGSQDIAQSYKDSQEPVYAMAQWDMTAYRASTTSPVKVLYDFVDRQLADFTSTVVQEYTDLPWRTYSCGYGCSDHASWNRAGYPSSSIFEPTTNPQIHTASDDLALIDWDLCYEFLKIALAIGVELSYGA